MIPVLFARLDSVYKQLGCDVYDINRDARSYTGSNAVIAHPPCRAWGRLRGMANPRPDEKDLAVFAVDKVRTNGGVLEHPESSSLWAHYDLPRPCPDKIAIDQYGGFTFAIAQSWFGHKARKNTWLYIVGIAPAQLPAFPIVLGEAQYVVTTGRRTKPWKKEITKAEREHTPDQLARWLIELVQIIEAKKAGVAA